MDANHRLYDRVLASAIKDAMADTPVVCLVGPRQCGKTTLVQLLAPERVFISLDDHNYLRTANDDPSGFIESLPDEVTLDEVQKAPELFPAIKRAVDQDRRAGRFLLTGSANLRLLPRITESLAGRMEIVQLQPLTEAEKGRSPGAFLRAVLEGALEPRISGMAKVGGANLPERLVAGGYPEPLTRSPKRARQWHRQYLSSIIERDVQDVARVRNANELSRLLELLALRSAELLNTSKLANDLRLNRETVEQYIAVLERLFLVRRLRAWHGNDSKRLIKAPKMHLLDSGLSATLADLKAQDWLVRRSQMGHLLEAFVVQQIIAQAAWTDPDLRFWHYRDKDKVEVDLVITRGPQTWGVEVKAGKSLLPKDAAGLSRLADRCGGSFQGGIVLYAGNDVLPMADARLKAVPLSLLWEL